MSGPSPTASVGTRVIARFIGPIDKSIRGEFKHFGLDVKYQE
jgi:hypothetical protein